MVERKSKARTSRAKSAETPPEVPQLSLPAPELPAIVVPAEAAQSAEVRSRYLLDSGKRREIIAILSLGCSRATAARYVGCHAATITRTATRDAEFAEQIRQAESLLEIKHLRNIDTAAKDARYWRAAAWALERKFPDRWGPDRAQGVTPEQVSQTLRQFAQLVIDEVTDAETQDHILKRMDELIDKAGAQHVEAEADHA